MFPEKQFLLWNCVNIFPSFKKIDRCYVPCMESLFGCRGYFSSEFKFDNVQRMQSQSFIQLFVRSATIHPFIKLFTYSTHPCIRALVRIFFFICLFISLLDIQCGLDRLVIVVVCSPRRRHLWRGWGVGLSLYWIENKATINNKNKWFAITRKH